LSEPEELFPPSITAACVGSFFPFSSSRNPLTTTRSLSDFLLAPCNVSSPPPLHKEGKLFSIPLCKHPASLVGISKVVTFPFFSFSGERFLFSPAQIINFFLQQLVQHLFSSPRFFLPLFLIIMKDAAPAGSFLLREQVATLSGLCEKR